MSRKTLKTTATLAAVLATAVVAPAAASANTDLRSPDAVDASRGVVVSTGQDLRSPDARDASRPVVVTAGQDLRSPDARDARFVPAGRPAGPAFARCHRRVPPEHEPRPDGGAGQRRHRLGPDRDDHRRDRPGADRHRLADLRQPPSREHPQVRRDARAQLNARLAQPSSRRLTEGGGAPLRGAASAFRRRSRRSPPRARRGRACGRGHGPCAPKRERPRAPEYRRRFRRVWLSASGRGRGRAAGSPARHRARALIVAACPRTRSVR